MGQFSFSQETWTDVSAGTEFSLALKSDGTIWSWGNNANGQLGIGNTTLQLEPVQVGEDMDWVKLSAGAFHVLGIKEDGTLWAWGLNNVGQLGLGDINQRNEPAQVGSDSDWKEIYLGQGHSIAIKNDNTLWTWGLNINGQLGNGNTLNQNIPAQVGTDSDWIMASGGGGHTLALKSDGSLWGFGFNGTGQLGLGAVSQNNTMPMRIGTDNDWDMVSAGFEFSLAKKTDGSIWSWGFNGNGQLGHGNTAVSLVPVQIGLGMDWTSLSAGSSFGFAINTAKELFGWGFNGVGQLGIGNTDQQTIPVRIGDENNWSKISAAAGTISGGSVFGAHTLAVHEEADVICAAGANYTGQLGDNTEVQSNILQCLTGLLEVSVTELSTSSDFLVSPNPSNGLFTVSFDDPKFTDYRCKIINLMGQVISENSINSPSFDVDLRGHSLGVYVVLLENENGSMNKRVVIE